MRAQLSLVFDDENLFDNFIKPYKEEKLLNNLIIKCLSAYYYDEDIRNGVEGQSKDLSGVDEVTSTQSLVDGIRASLIMQDFLASELQDTIDAGTPDVSQILNKTNEAAEKSGVAKTTKTEYGASVLKLEQHETNMSTDESEQKRSEDDLSTKVIDLVKSLAESGNDLSAIKEILTICLAVVSGIKQVEKEDDSEPTEQGQLPVDIEVENPNESNSGVVKSYATVQEKAKAEAEQTARENKAFLGRGHYSMSADAVIVSSDSIERIQTTSDNLNQALQQYNEAVVSLQEVAM
jgi:hypothetical protein